MSLQDLHKTQVSILHSLRYSSSARFNTLMQPTDHTSDTFKFHLRKLIKLGYVTKIKSGGYQLTTVGKEFANSLDELQRTIKKQPKLSVLIVAAKQNEKGEQSFLLQQRVRNPYLGFWNEITDAVRWGESFEDAAARALHKQTGLTADFKIHSMRRVRDYDEALSLLEDKLFIVVEATNLKGKLQNNYAGGINTWLTLEELKKQDKYFASTIKIIEDLTGGNFYAAHDFSYAAEEY